MTHDTHQVDSRRMVLFGPSNAVPPVAGWCCRPLSNLNPATPDAAALELVVIHEPTLRQNHTWDGFLAWLETWRRTNLPVLLVYREIAAWELAVCFRAGLFDAVSVAADQAEWSGVLARAAARIDAAVIGGDLNAQREGIQRRLQEHQRRLNEEASAEADALLAAQTQLETANKRLSDHMAQVTLLYKFCRELSLASNWDDTLREILANLAQFVGAAGGALVLQAADGGRIAPRQTYRWQEQSWDKVLLRITSQIDTGVASSLLAPGVFQVGGRGGDRQGRITALPLEHQGVRLGMLLLLFASPQERRDRSDANLTFLQMVQVVLSEEIASAQMLDRLRDIGTFNTRVLQTVSSGIWVCDARGRTVFVNRAARVLLGLEAGLVRQDAALDLAVGRGRLLERPLTGGAETDDLPEIFLDGRLQLSGSGPRRYEYLLARQMPFNGEGHLEDVRGQAVPVRVQTAPMAGRGLGEHWILVILEDMREAERAAAARQRAEQAEALVAMSATLAHEIRNPLMGLSGQAELLADSLPADDARRRRLDLITGEVERINRTINDMLQFVRPSEPRPETIDPARLAYDCLELARPRADQRGVGMQVLAPQPIQLEADPVQIKQVILNLVLNAVDAAPEGGAVTIRLQQESALVLPDRQHGTLRTVSGVGLVVEDDGPGFGDIEPQQIFKPFFTTKTTGTGLGLAYCRKVVEAHGGRIRAQRDGALTRVSVLLPREAAAGKTLAGEAT